MFQPPLFSEVDEQNLRLLLAKRIAHIALEARLSPANIEALTIHMLGLDRDNSAELAAICPNAYTDRLERTCKALKTNPPKRLYALAMGLTVDDYKPFRTMIQDAISRAKESPLQSE